jgi:N-acylneuraminate cytidylyltransferase
MRTADGARDGITAGVPPTIVALVPARAGSKRVKGKNIRILGGHPLLAYTIAAARASSIFDAVVVSTDSETIAAVARHYGAEVPFLRPAAFAGETSPDIDWVDNTLTRLRAAGRAWDCFSILRPTSPFRRPETIRRAWAEFRQDAGVDSLRAVEKCRQHPAKMWIVRGRRMFPLLPMGPAEQPWHSSQYQSLFEVYAQNASLEIAWTRVVTDGRTIAGHVVMPFFAEGLDGFDINDARDWRLAEELVRTGEATLPAVPCPPAVLEPDRIGG